MVLDAGVLIALMNPGDAHYADAVAVVRRGAVAGALVAHAMTVAESAVGAAEHGLPFVHGDGRHAEHDFRNAVAINQCW